MTDSKKNYDEVGRNVKQRNPSTNKNALVSKTAKQIIGKTGQAITSAASASRQMLHHNNLALSESVPEGVSDLVCFSHLRWDFVYQRPQHLLSRFAKERRVFFIEEPVYDAGPIRTHVSERDCGAIVMVPWLPENMRDNPARDAVLQGLVDRFFVEQKIEDYFLWYYSPLAMSFTHHLKPQAVVYDCMDELSGFKDAPPALRFCEAELFRRADLVFTGGQSLYEAKRKQHPKHGNIYAFPSSIDAAHFAQARSLMDEPEDQASIPHPRLGFFGVIDERLDLELLDGIAQTRPDWQLVIVGPIVKIDDAKLPRRANIHYLGGKDYKELPKYLAGWDIGIMPFARNAATRFISPTKTPEYLAAGCPVISTSIHDVVRPYGEKNLVKIADTVAEFVNAAEATLKDDGAARLPKVDAFLAQTSWDLTWSRMTELIEDAIDARRGAGQSATASRGLKQRAVGASSLSNNMLAAS